MFRAEMRVTTNHLGTLPSAQLLQREQRRSVLHVPARPGVPQIMPAKVFDAGALERLVPCFRADLSDRLPAETEHARRMFPDLLAYQRQRLRVERDGDRSPRLRLIGMNPR